MITTAWDWFAGSDVLDVTAALDLLPAFRWPFPHGDQVIANLDLICERAKKLAAQATRRSVDQVRLMSPVANPSKIIAAPLNYLKHVEESRTDVGINFGTEISAIDRYGLFLKSNTSLIGAGQAVRLPSFERRIDHEIELAVIIAKACYKVPIDSALRYVAGYALALDMTVRGTEDRSWRKSFDTFSVLGPWLTTADEISNPNALEFWIKVGGAFRQHSNTKHLIFGVERLTGC